MKKFIFIFLFLIAHCTLNIENCMSQLPPRYYWRVIPSPVQTNLNCIISTNNGLYIFGDNGTQLYSTDNGNSFQSLSGLPNLNFYSISNYINGRYTIVGQNGAIYYHQGSLPGTWSQEVSGTTSTLVSISSIHDTCSIFYRYAVGAGGIILKSTWILGTWSSWSPVYSGTTQDLNCIFLLQDNGNRVGWITGNNGTLLKTTNCGINWNIKFTGVTNKLNCIRFDDSTTGLITVSNGLIMKTTNGGNNWLTITSGTSADLKDISKVFFQSYFSNYSYFICGSGGLVLQGNDSGTSWRISPTYINNNLNSITYQDYYYFFCRRILLNNVCANVLQTTLK